MSGCEMGGVLCDMIDGAGSMSITARALVAHGFIENLGRPTTSTPRPF